MVVVRRHGILFSWIALAGALAAVAACDDSTITPSSADAGVSADAGPSPSVGDAGDAGAGDGGATAPITIGQGHRPGVAVDSAGTAYIAWYGPESNTTTLRFCRLPRGAAACDVTSTIAAPGTTLTRPFPIVSGSTVRVVSYRYGLTGSRFDAVYVFTSTDRGATFDAGRMIGSVPYEEVAVGLGDSVSFATDAYSGGEVFESAPLGGTAPPAIRATLSTDHVYSGAVGFFDPATPIVTFADGSGNAQLRRYKGSGDVNDVASWDAPKELGQASYMQMASGPSGLFLKARSGTGTLDVRRFDGSTFGPAVTVPEGHGELPQSHLTEDPAGRLHAVWPRIDVDGTRFYYATSDDGASWKTALLYIHNDAMAAMRVAAASDHVGVAVFETPEPAVRVIAVGPSASP